MNSPIEVDDEMFAVLESYAGTETCDARVVQLAGESMCAYAYTGLYFIEVPDLDDSVLEDWNKADAWLEELCGIIAEDLLPEGLPENIDIYGDSNVSPLVIYGSLEKFKKLAIQKKIECLQEDKSSVAFVEVTNAGRVLNLVYDDVDDWAFDFNGSVKVYRDLDFTEENGYYS